MGDSKNLASFVKFCSSYLVKNKQFSSSFRNLFLYTVLFLFAGWCYITFRADIASISIDTVWEARSAILAAALLSLVNYLLRIIRWSTYLKRFGFRFPVVFTGLSYVAGFAFTLSPGKVGEMIKARYYKEAGVPLSMTMAAFFVERLMDMLAMTGLALLGFALLSGYAAVLWISLAGMLGMLIILACAPWGLWQRRLVQRQRIPATLRHTLNSIVQTVISARTLLHPRLLVFGFLIGLLAWSAEGLGLMVLGNLAPAVPIDWASAIGIYAVAILIGALSFLPGGLGGTEVVMATLLAAHGYSMPQAILLTMMCRIITLWFAVMLGWSAVLALRHYPEPVLLKS
ncbi:MAG: lysylphosphatidylglycerol synthase transmembrane domain-containing protein [Burkholderiaceae bacterium]